MQKLFSTPVKLDNGDYFSRLVNGDQVMSQTSTLWPIPLVMEGLSASGQVQPVRAGIPLPRGTLRDAERLRLINADGRPEDVQVSPLARWPDGSLQWVLVEYLAASAPGCTTWSLTLDPQPGSQREAGRIAIENTAADIRVDTGTAVFHLDGSALPFARVVVAGEDIVEAKMAQMPLTAADGSVGLPHLDEVALEATGPVRATIRCQGTFTGSVPVRWVARLCFFAGTGLVRLSWTIHNPRRARHRGGLWDLGDAGSWLFRDLSLLFRVSRPDSSGLYVSPEAGQALRAVAQGPLEIYQDSSGGENWQSKNHVNRQGRVCSAFRGYRLRAAGREERGDRANPVVSVRGPNGAATVAVPEFWQQFPKAIRVKDGWVRVGLFPEQFDDLYELQGGEQKTHVVWLHFGGPNEPALTPLDWVHQPVRVRPAPVWNAATGAVPFLVPNGMESDHRLESLLSNIVSGPSSFFARREIIDEFGWRNFGDLYADHEGAHYPGPTPVVSHYNNQYDALYGLLVHYLRTGDVRWFELLDPLARHVIDIDIYHTQEDIAAYNGGLFWHTDHYRDAATSTHRCYSRANCGASGRAYGGGPSNEHNYSTGLLYYYYLTGNPDAKAAVLSLADWVVAMDDGRQNVLGLVNGEATGLASRTRDADYHGPGRGCGNSINTLLNGWLVSGQRAYLEKAEALIRRSVHPADDVEAYDLAKAELRWSYTVFLAVLARYLTLKAEMGELDADYAYARASLLHYARWMLANEKPYLDHPEQLEYPTETWAAQEIRKANVLRLAAAHADEPLQGQLTKRGEELADRGWADLLRFDSRNVTRALAILMVEGWLDVFFRRSCVKPAPRPFQDHDFGAPMHFVPQRRQVLAQMRSVKGLAQALRRLTRLDQWRRVLRRGRV
jgi:hypothetical protein